MNFDKSNLKWSGTKVGSMLIDVCDLANSGKIIVVRSPKILSLSINSKFWVSSYEKAMGVPHLMEHCLFSNVLDGQSMFKCKSELTRLGISLNAQTSHKDITLLAYTASCMSSDRYPNDATYSILCYNYEYNKLLKRIADIHYNLITTDVDDDYMNQEKNVIYGEMQARYPGDAQSIRKTAEWSALSGARYSSIGNQYNLKDITKDHINFMRNKTFSHDNLKTIVIYAPDFVAIDDILDNYIAKLFDGLSVNDDIVAHAGDKYNKEVIEFVEKYTSVRFKPDQRSFQVRSIESEIGEHNEDIYMHKVKPVKNAGVIKDIIINMPTIKITLNNILSSATSKALAQVYIQQKLNEYYREKHPVTYGVGKYIESWKWIYRKSYSSTSFILRMATDADSKEFINSLDKFKEWCYNEEEIDKCIKSWEIADKNSWYAFMNGDMDMDNPITSFNEIGEIMLGRLSESAEEKVRFLDGYKVEDGKLFPKLLVDKYNYVLNNKDTIYKYVKTYLTNWKINVFDSTNVIETEKKFKKDFDKKLFKKDEYKKPYKK